ncbi:MAG: iron-sulfur cluster assembly scaffold protein [Candidatus Aenigmarchaeota archaeon]|nr:iron-sulfur cluster assembly scaffold protein [Candidatus Aenigmarchaeota archaeon]
MPITKTQSSNYNGYVHNLEVEGSKTYVTEPAILHNCGDVMYIYIKVKDDKIVDIGWETMGCAAAIATTSMLSEMAKGKTLDEAMKLTKQDVADELDGLPPIKMHCSNLAADALHEAIQKYREKLKKKKSK